MNDINSQQKFWSANDQHDDNKRLPIVFVPELKPFKN